MKVILARNKRKQVKNILMKYASRKVPNRNLINICEKFQIKNKRHNRNFIDTCENFHTKERKIKKAKIQRLPTLNPQI